MNNTQKEEEKPKCESTPPADSNWITIFNKEFPACDCRNNLAPHFEDSKVNRNWIKDFIEQTLQQERQRERERIIEIIKSNSKGSFTDAGGNDCWYIDALIKSLSSNKPSNE